MFNIVFNLRHYLCVLQQSNELYFLYRGIQSWRLLTGVVDVVSESNPEVPREALLILVRLHGQEFLVGLRHEERAERLTPGEAD